VFRPAVVVICALIASSAAAQNIEILGPPAPQAPSVFAKDERGRITLRATRLASPLSLDGALDENVYREVQSIDHFVQQEPDEGAAGTEKTLVWLFFDDSNFYVSVRSFDTAPERLVANELRRDNFNIYNNDNITISIDSLYTRRSGVFFQTNALSAQRDQEVQDERSNNNDWNTIWRTRSKILEDGWSMEFAIPYSSLRFRAAGPQVWGFNIRRVVRWKNEHTSIAPIPASAGTRAMYKFDIMATVVGIETPSVRKPIDVKPYAIAASTTNLAGASPFRNDPSADAGVDVKYSLTNSLVADFTYRTDFAQVEEDQQQVNLTRFSLFFPEKRDFFLEGQGLFSFGAEQRGGGGGGQTSARTNTPSLTPVVFYSRRIGLGSSGEIPIIGGARMAGRAGKFGLGLLTIQTEAGEAGDTGEAGEAGEAGDTTNFSVIRLRRDVLRRSNVGLIATRRTPSDAAVNTVLGADANFFFFNNLTATGYYAQSRTEQRAGIDQPAALARSSYRAEVDYQPDRFGLKYEHLLVGSRFQPEIGFLRRAAFRRNYASGRFSPRPAAGPVRRHVFEAEFDYVTGSDDGRLETREAKVAYRAELRGNDQFGIDYSNNYEFLRTGFSIVPGRIIAPGAYRFGDVRAVYVFGPQRRISGSISGGTGSFYGGTNTELGARGYVELSPRFNVEPAVTVNALDIDAGKFTTSVVSTRASYMFSPHMALSGLVQYNSTGSSLGSSVRFRWEYRPGSDFFVVYSDGRDTRIGDRFPGLMNRTFVVKATRLFRF
jgi:hypothetical protein